MVELRLAPFDIPNKTHTSTVLEIIKFGHYFPVQRDPDLREKITKLETCPEPFGGVYPERSRRTQDKLRRRIKNLIKLWHP